MTKQERESIELAELKVLYPSLKMHVKSLPTILRKILDIEGDYLTAHNDEMMRLLKAVNTYIENAYAA